MNHVGLRQAVGKILHAGARAKLKEFSKDAWHVIEQGRDLYWNWHHVAICDHAQAALEGEIPRLIITTPPGTTKSRIAQVMLPAWRWLDQPWHRWLCVANADELATRDSLACRRIVESEWYRGEFNCPWGLTTDQNMKTWYETTANGHRHCQGINAQVTGKKGDTIIIDDPNDAVKAFSAAERARVINAYESGISDRLIDFKRGAIIVIGQRTHEDDLIGYLKRGGGWFELKLQESWRKSSRYVSPIGWSDPRRIEGEMLRPEKFGPAEADGIKQRDLMRWETKHQQEPRAKEGIRFKRKYFKNRWRMDGDFMVLTSEKGTLRFLPHKDFLMRFITADGASSAKTTADYTAISTWIITSRFDLVWIGCKRVQVEIPDQPDILAKEYQSQAVQFAGIEAALSNVALAQFAQRTSMVIRELSPKGLDKLARAVPAIVLAEAGRVWLPHEIEAERCGFPFDEVFAELLEFTGTKIDKHDDIVDTLSYAAEILNESDGNTPGGGIAGIGPPGPLSFVVRDSTGSIAPSHAGTPGVPGKPRQMIVRR